MRCDFHHGFRSLYSQKRPHMALDGKTPDEFYCVTLPALSKTTQALTARLP